MLKLPVTCVLLLLCLCRWTCAQEPLTIFEGTALAVPKQPQAFVSADDTVHLTFGVADRIHYAKYDGEGLHAAREIASVPNMSLGMRRGPRIAASDKSIVITAIGGPKGKGADGDVMAFRSTDHGATWSTPVRVNELVGSAREGLHAMTASADGTFWCVWLDLRHKKTELFASCSTDGGQTWQPNQLIYRSPDGSICECCHPSIATDGDSVHVLFRNSVQGNRDMYLVSSKDRGKTWSTASRLGREHWELNACPMDGGSLVIQDGVPKTAWRRGGMIYFADLKSSAERLVGKGEQPSIAATKSGTAIVWTAGREGDLLLSNLDDSQPKVLAPSARDPIIVSSRSQREWSMVFWEQRAGDQTKIRALKIAD